MSGSPILGDAHSFADCKVINAMDAGDMTTFLVNVIDGGIVSGGEWMTLSYFYSAAPPEWIAEYGEKLSRSVAFSLDRIQKITYKPWSP
jgi:flavin reductase (DIM6/NTAB) family NADH-FMN oxidoreductase RutF